MSQIFQGACQVNNDKIIVACTNYRALYDKLVAIYNDDMEKLKKTTYVVKSLFFKNKIKSLHDDFLMFARESWMGKNFTYTTYWKDGKGIHWTPLEKAVFSDSYEETYHDLKKLSSMKSDLVLINPNQAKFIDNWAENNGAD